MNEPSDFSVHDKKGGYIEIKYARVQELIAENKKLKVVYDEVMKDKYIQSIARQSLRDALKDVQ